MMLIKSIVEAIGLDSAGLGKSVRWAFSVLTGSTHRQVSRLLTTSGSSEKGASFKLSMVISGSDNQQLAE